jgi:signal transduction histidine kinase
MTPGASAVVLSACVTAATGGAGAVALALVARRRPALAALCAPIVLVGSLGLGVAVATRQMLIAQDDYRTVLFVLLAGAPVAVLIGVVTARRMSRLERDAARREAEVRRAQQVEQSRRETIRWLSHDLRTPLAGIRALAESLEQGAVADPRAAHAAVVREVDRIDAMVDDIAALSRLTGETAHRMDRVDLDDLVSDAVATISPLAAAAGVEIRSVGLSGSVVTGDAADLVRAVTNVLRNAVQHTPSGGAVDVRAWQADGRAAVAVADGCTGIAGGDLERVFEPGYRGDLARAGSGAGLGLAITREVVRAHGGDAQVANRTGEPGCVVTLDLPSRP